MRRFSENTQCILIVLFSLWFLVLPAYLYFCIIDASDMAPSYPLLEKTDQEGLTAIPGEKEKILKLTFSITDALITYPSLAWVPSLSYQLPALDSKPLVLRC